MFRYRILLLITALSLTITACGGLASLPARLGSSDNDDLSTRVAATLNVALPTSVAATLNAPTATPTQDMMAAMMAGMSPEELATHMVLMETGSSGTPTPFSSPTPFPTFTPAPTQAVVENLPSPAPACTNLAEFVKHLTINDNTAIEGGAGFAKLWRVKNAGTCTWTTAYALVFAAGEQLGGPASIPLTQEVLPGQTVDLRVNLIAPHIPGFYTGSWMFQDANGSRFGLIPDGSQPLNLTIQIKPHNMEGHHH